jgi:hypothetical protein
MILFLLACQGDKAHQQCSTDSMLTYDGKNFSLPADSCNSINLTPRMIKTGDVSLHFEQLENGWQPVITAQTQSTIQAVILEGELTLEGSSPTRIWKQGYQSWWWSGVSDLTEMEFNTETSLPIVGGDGDATSATEEKPYTSWWNGLLGKNDGSSLFVGALASTKTKFWTAFSENETWIVWGARGENINLQAGEELRLDPVWIKTGTDPFSLHRQYAQHAAGFHNLDARTDKPPVGWATWYTFYENISEEIILSNLDEATSLAMDTQLEPMFVFQIDDGWQKHWGDWTANDQFPSGMEALAVQIQQAGFTPGLWMAPFYVSVETETYQEHDDWWVRDETGNPIHFSNLGSGDYVIIDVTHPQAGPWMKDQVEARVADGWDYFKLDFLYAGAQEGSRYADVTSIEAFHIGMEYLMEALDGRFLLACGAPMLPSLGYADAFRTGADIGFGFDPGPRREYLRWQLRSTAARSWQNQLWWWVDPDQILLREPFSIEELTGAITANIVSGGAWIIGDDLTTIQEERIAFGLDKETVSFRGIISEPLHPLKYASVIDLGPVSALTNPDLNPPLIYRLSNGHTAYINLGDSPIILDNISGTEFFSGETADNENRTIAAGSAEIWLQE